MQTSPERGMHARDTSSKELDEDGSEDNGEVIRLETGSNTPVLNAVLGRDQDGWAVTSYLTVLIVCTLNV